MSAALEVAIFCGSCEWTDRETIRRDLESLPTNSVVIEGGDIGAAQIARDEARLQGIHVATLHSLWDSNYLTGIYRRNEAMARLRPDFVYAYNLGTGGTEQMIRVAEADCIPVRER